MDLIEGVTLKNFVKDRRNDQTKGLPEELCKKLFK